MIDRAIEQFVESVTNLSIDQPIEGALEEALAAERDIRFLFASDPQNDLLQSLDLGLIDVFNLHPAARRTRARQITAGENSSDQFVFPIDTELRRPNFMPSTVSNLAAFQQRWEIFTHGALSRMTSKDWKNVVAAGGSVLACLAASYPNVSDRALNQYYQSRMYASADIDLFLWGLSPKEAEVKMNDIYRAVCLASLGWRVTCVRKANTVSIHTTYPFRPIQIVLRLYRSPAEILAGFDIDAACCAYNGQLIPRDSSRIDDVIIGVRVLVNPRALAALIRQTNTIDLTRRSPSYELRLAKYAERGFEVYIPTLRRDRIKPWLYSRNLPAFPDGLARLLVLEEAYYRPTSYRFVKYPQVRHLQHGSISRDMDRDANDLPSNNYDGNLGWAQIPYGLPWDAERIEKMVARKDAWINSPDNPRNEGQVNHRHIFFAGTMQQCLTTFCADCDLPEDTDDIEAPGFNLYIQGPIKFMVLNPGRQLLTGSFRPLEVAEWASEAYVDRGDTGNVIQEGADDSSSESGSDYTDAHSEFLPMYSE